MEGGNAVKRWLYIILATIALSFIVVVTVIFTRYESDGTHILFKKWIHVEKQMYGVVVNTTTGDVREVSIDIDARQKLKKNKHTEPSGKMIIKGLYEEFSPAGMSLLVDGDDTHMSVYYENNESSSSFRPLVMLQFNGDTGIGTFNAFDGEETYLGYIAPTLNEARRLFDNAKNMFYKTSSSELIDT